MKMRHYATLLKSLHLLMEKKLNETEIIRKASTNEELTKEESLFYWTEVIGMTEEEAERIWEISENDNPDILID